MYISLHYCPFGCSRPCPANPSRPSGMVTSCWHSMVGGEPPGRIFITNMDASYPTTNKASTSREHTESHLFASWFVIDKSETDANGSLAKLSPFVIGKALKAQIGTLKTNRRLQSGAILVEASNRSHSEQLHRLQ